MHRSLNLIKCIQPHTQKTKDIKHFPDSKKKETQMKWKF